MKSFILLVVLRGYIVFQYISSYFPRCISYIRVIVLCFVYWNSCEKWLLCHNRQIIGPFVYKNIPVGQRNSYTGLEISLRVQEFETPRISRQSAQISKLSAPRPGHLYTHCFHLRERLNRLRDNSAAERIKPMNNPNYFIGNRTCNLQLLGQCPNQLRYHVPLPQWRIWGGGEYKFKTGNWETFTNTWQRTVQLCVANCC